MDDDLDIYGDLPSFNVNECARCKEKSKERTETNEIAEENGLFWKLKCDTLDEEKKTIVTNSSSLLKTARAEIARKDRIILELRRELEDLKFKRGVWSRANKNYPEYKDRGKRSEVKRKPEELPLERIKTLLTNDQPAWEASEEDDDDTEKKWRPDRKNFTVYGERLRRKICLEQEAERSRREEAKIFVSDGSTARRVDLENHAEAKINDDDDGSSIAGTKILSSVEQAARKNASDEDAEEPEQKWRVDEKNCKEYEEERAEWKISLERETGRARREEKLEEEKKVFSKRDAIFVKIEEKINEESENASLIVKSEYRISESSEDSRDPAIVSKRRIIETRGFGSNSSSDDYKNRRNVDYPYERHSIENFHRRDGNFDHDHRCVSSRESRDESRANYPRDAPDHLDRDRKNRAHRYYQQMRSINEKFDKSNYRSRSKTPERRCDDKKRYEKTKKYRNDRSDKRRGNETYGCNFGEYSDMDNYDLRERLNRRNDDKFGEKSVNRNYRNYDSDHRRRGKSRSPVRKSRSKSSSAARNERSDKRRCDRSIAEKSPVNGKNKGEFVEDRDDQERGSKNRKIVVNPRNDTIILRQSNFVASSNVSAENSTSRSMLRDKSEISRVAVKTANFEETEVKFVDNTEAATATIVDLIDQVEAREKFVIMLENDSEMILSPPMKNETIEPVGSRSFREEKIENIEKFIQDYRYDEAAHCSLLGNGEKSNDEDKFVNSTRSIVDTLSMDIEDFVPVDGEPKDRIIVNSEYSPSMIVEDPAICRKFVESAVDEKLENLDADEKSKDIFRDKKFEDVTSDEKLKDSESAEKTRDAAIERKIKVIAYDRNLAIGVNSEILAVDENRKDFGLSEKTKDAGREKKSKDFVSDVKMRNFAKIDDEAGKNLFDKNRKNDEKSETMTVEKKSDDSRIVEKSESIILRAAPPLPPSPELAPLPPLPPSPELAALPPLPSSPPPEVRKEAEIIRKIFTFEPDIAKTQAERAPSKQSKNRPRIPCLPIVSLYSRKRRVLVLTDSVASRTIVRSAGAVAFGDKNGTEKPKIHDIPEIVKKNSPEPANRAKSAGTMEIQMENSTKQTIISEMKKVKIVLDNLTEAPNISGSKNIDSIGSRNVNSLLESCKPEVNSRANEATFESADKFNDESTAADVSATRKKNNVPRARSSERANEARNTRAEVESGRGRRSKNSDKDGKMKNSGSTKSAERGKRSALKVLASSLSSSDAADSSNRKRILSKEKENQSKPAKQAKIMIVARRRPVRLEDSSTATTLVSSQRDESFGDNNEPLGIPVKINNPARKRCTANK